MPPCNVALAREVIGIIGGQAEYFLHWADVHLVGSCTFHLAFERIGGKNCFIKKDYDRQYGPTSLVYDEMKRR